MSKEYDGTRATDRRNKPRRSSSARVWADPGGVVPAIDCKLVDVSDRGAKVAPMHGRELPEQFSLELEPTRSLGEAKVVWREGSVVGVQLKNS
ncbi:MAG: hypothetical protein ACLPN5_14685 [Roseiarcus sp.]